MTSQELGVGLARGASNVELNGAVPAAVAEVNHQADDEPSEENLPSKQVQRNHHQ